MVCNQKVPAGSSEVTVNTTMDGMEQEADVYKEQFGTRFIVRCDDFKLRLQANVADDGQPERLDNVRCFSPHLCLLSAVCFNICNSLIIAN